MTADDGEGLARRLKEKGIMASAIGRLRDERNVGANRPSSSSFFSSRRRIVPSSPIGPTRTMSLGTRSDNAEAVSIVENAVAGQDLSAIYAAIAEAQALQ